MKAQSKAELDAQQQLHALETSSAAELATKVKAMYQQQQGELESTVQDQAAKLEESKRALASVESSSKDELKLLADKAEAALANQEAQHQSEAELLRAEVATLTAERRASESKALAVTETEAGELERMRFEHEASLLQMRRDARLATEAARRSHDSEMSNLREAHVSALRREGAKHTELKAAHANEVKELAAKAEAALANQEYAHLHDKRAALAEAQAKSNGMATGAPSTASGSGGSGGSGEDPAAVIEALKKDNQRLKAEHALELQRHEDAYRSSKVAMEEAHTTEMGRRLSAQKSEIDQVWQQLREADAEKNRRVTERLKGNVNLLMEQIEMLKVAQARRQEEIDSAPDRQNLTGVGRGEDEARQREDASRNREDAVSHAAEVWKLKSVSLPPSRSLLHPCFELGSPRPTLRFHQPHHHLPHTAAEATLR